MGLSETINNVLHSFTPDIQAALAKVDRDSPSVGLRAFLILKIKLF
jgi:hypothetical protein